MPPVAEHAADDGLQDEGPHDFNHSATSDQEFDPGMIAEFVGPGNKVYHNYHVGLNSKSTHTLSYLYSYILLQHEDVTRRVIFYQMMLRPRPVYVDRQMIGPHTATG